MKTCTVCREHKKKSEFHRDKSRRDGLCDKCKICNRAHAKSGAEKKPRYYHWVYELNYYYGLTVEQYQKMLLDQNGKCAVCSGEPTMYKKLYVDHCHDTKQIRGLLCGHCNTGIGYFKNDSTRLRVAADYVEKLSEYGFVRNAK